MRTTRDLGGDPSTRSLRSLGRVVGIDPATGALRVTLVSDTEASVQAIACDRESGDI